MEYQNFKNLQSYVANTILSSAGSRQQSGFSLIETLVAITILLIVIIGPMSISSQSAQSTSFASEQVVAFFLAQEGLELAQKVRNDKFNAYYAGAVSTPWQSFRNDINSCSGSGCGLEIRNDGTVNIISCIYDSDTGQDTCNLDFDAAAVHSLRSRYTHQNLSNLLSTPYTRRIIFELVPSSSGQEYKVTSRVTWYSGNIRDEQAAVAETFLLNTYGE